MKLTFWGAARTVTGSSHLLQFDGRTVMLDCGLYQGSRKLAREMNAQFAVPTQNIDLVLLSHAHVDHSGNLPSLVKHGYKNPIHCTSATTDLVRVLLRDSGFIQERDVEFVNKRHKKRGEPRIEPLYTVDDAERTLPLLRSHYYRQPFELLGGKIRIEYYDAGHILGSSFLDIGVRENGTEKKLVFSGDLGRKNMPILEDPDQPPEADYLILESTYGNRVHEEYEKVEDKLAAAMNKVIGRGGKIVVPSFSVGRTQELVYALNRLFSAGKLPRIPIYVDSPLSVNVTEVFRNHPECYDAEVKRVLLHDPDPFGFQGLIYVRDVETSKSINELDSPCMIISASGMAEAGRILHHLSNTIQNPKNAVMIVGFQAENTLGRRIVDRMPEVKIFGEMHKLAAEVFVFNAFSAHAGADDLRSFAREVARGKRLKKVFLVHGEEEIVLEFQKTLQEDLPGVQVLAPKRGETYEI